MALRKQRLNSKHIFSLRKDATATFRDFFRDKDNLSSKDGFLVDPWLGTSEINAIDN